MSERSSGSRALSRRSRTEKSKRSSGRRRSRRELRREKSALRSKLRRRRMLARERRSAERKRRRSSASGRSTCSASSIFTRTSLRSTFATTSSSTVRSN